MAEKLFSLFRKEQRRLDLAIADAAARGCADHGEIGRLKALRTIVDDQMASWTRDLYGPGSSDLASAA
ncbi:hypothetical protein [Novosphingobium kaempferiae]|uniref:hypothetical protein n=1 Tax=Novosphingobium kaempferiae TaxID=2896849 RepID=UPI001E61F334|nr:hypothetical protein [Novosphingobium kaempferiae]